MKRYLHLLTFKASQARFQWWLGTLLEMLLSVRRTARIFGPSGVCFQASDWKLLWTLKCQFRSKIPNEEKRSYSALNLFGFASQRPWLAPVRKPATTLQLYLSSSQEANQTQYAFHIHYSLKPALWLPSYHTSVKCSQLRPHIAGACQV